MSTWRTRACATGLTLAWLLGAPAGEPGVGAKQKGPLEVTRVQDLRFGLLGLDGTGDGWAVVDPKDGARQVGGAVFGLGGGYGPAEFEVVGEPGAQFVIDLPNRVRIDSTVNVVDFTSLPAGLGALGLDGRATVMVGALVEVRHSAGPGYRSDDFMVKVRYL